MSKVDYRHAIYAGSFDPITIGHLAIIERANRLYDKVTVAVGVNPNKKTLFSLEERESLLKSTLASYEHVHITSFEGLLVRFAESVGAGVMIRGLRLLADFEHEFQLALANRELAPDLETVFMMTESRHLHISSSLVKEIGQNGGELKGLVPGPVEAALKQKLGV